MYRAIKITSNIKPDKFEQIENNIWYYNFNIEDYDTQEDFLQLDNQDYPKFSFVNARIIGKPTFTKCLKQVLKLYIDEYNNNLYKVFLKRGDNQQIKSIRKQISEDFKKEFKNNNN